MDWLAGLVGLGAIVGTLVRKLPERGWLRNKFIPRWIQGTTLLVTLGSAMAQFNQAAGFSSLLYHGPVALAGFGLNWPAVWPFLRDYVLVPVGKAWLATWLAKKGYDEANREAARPLPDALPAPVPVKARGK